MEIAASRPEKLGRCGSSPGHFAVRSGPAGPRRPRRRARSERAWTMPVIVQDEEPGGNPGSVRTQGGFLSPVLDGRPIEKSRENRNSGAINARVATGSALSDFLKPSTLC